MENKKTKTQPNTKFLPIFNGRNRKTDPGQIRLQDLCRPRRIFNLKAGNEKKFELIMKQGITRNEYCEQNYLNFELISKLISLEKSLIPD